MLKVLSFFLFIFLIVLQVFNAQDVKKMFSCKFDVPNDKGYLENVSYVVE